MAGSSIGTSRRSRRSGAGARAPEQRGLPYTVCGFWLGQQCFAVAADIVGEVVPVDAYTPVPLAPAAILGLFNLRGTPVALADTPRALGLAPAEGGEPPAAPAGVARVALVLRARDLVVGALIGRMEMVVPAGRGRFRPRSESHEESPLVEGFLEIDERGLVMTVLSSAEVVARLAELRSRRADDESWGDA
jgi:purine-binding chemotaxis protein CheW